MKKEKFISYLKAIENMTARWDKLEDAFREFHNGINMMFDEEAHITMIRMLEDLSGDKNGWIEHYLYDCRKSVVIHRHDGVHVFDEITAENLLDIINVDNLPSV